MILIFLSGPGALEFWEQCKVFNSGEFRRFVDNLDLKRATSG